MSASTGPLSTVVVHVLADPNTKTLQTWIQGNVIPLVLLLIAVTMLWIGGRGDHAGIAKRAIGLVVGLTVLGITVSGHTAQVATYLANMIMG
jgi:hypothetical protein